MLTGFFLFLLESIDNFKPHLLQSQLICLNDVQMEKWRIKNTALCESEVVTQTDIIIEKCPLYLFFWVQ